jgi:hypothetical protein
LPKCAHKENDQSDEMCATSQATKKKSIQKTSGNNSKKKMNGENKSWFNK